MEKHPWNSEYAVSSIIAELIKIKSCSNVLEIGVFQGQTGLAMINALPKDGTYTALDITEENYTTEFKTKLKKHTSLVGNSLELLHSIPNRSVDLIFIDSVHEYAHLSKEFKICENIIKQNGLIVLHDSILFLGVAQFVKELKNNKGFEILTLETPEEGDRTPSGLTIIKCLYP